MEAILYDATEVYPNNYQNYNAPSVQALVGKIQKNSGNYRYAGVGLSTGTLHITVWYTK